MMQQTEQIQESEFISLKDFITNWTEVVEEMDKENISSFRSTAARNKGLDFSNSKYCMIGEAYGNDDSYRSVGEGGCPTCDDWCVMRAYDALHNGGEVFKEFKETLYNHMIDNHPEKMRR